MDENTLAKIEIGRLRDPMFVIQVRVPELIEEVRRLRALAQEASRTLSALRPGMTLQTQEQWDSLEVLHNRLALDACDSGGCGSPCQDAIRALPDEESK